MRREGVEAFTKRNILRAALVFTVFAVLVLSIILAVNLYERYNNGYDGEIQQNVGGEKIIEYNGQTYVFNKNVETFLLIGLDTFGKAEENDSYNNDKQADLLTLFVLDREKEICHAIHINRDTMAQVPILGVTGQKVGAANEQIALSHTYGNGGIDSCRNVANAVSNLMCGMPIDNYLSLTMDGIVALNDLVGGVTLTAIGDFSDVDGTIIEGEVLTLLGEHALNYVRNRSDGTNETRMARQRQYMEALYAQIMNYIDDNGELSSDMTMTLGEYAVTNCDVSDIDDLFSKMSSYEFGGIKTIDGESVLGEKYMEFICDENALKELLIELCYLPKK